MRKFSFLKGKLNYFYFALILFICSLPLSEFMVSASGGILLLTAWIEDKWQNKIVRIKDRKLLLFIPAIFLIYLLSAVITHNGETVLYDLRKALFFIILPLAFLVGKEITSKQKLDLIILFVFSVLFATIYAIINWKFFGKSQNLHIHNASFITHIRFSFQLILAIWVLVFFIYKNYLQKKWKLNVAVAFITMFLLSFMFIQQSLTGLVSLLLSVIIVLIGLIFRLKNKLRYILLVIAVIVIVSPVLYIAQIAYPFYYPEQINLESLPKTTLKGNPYHHNLNNQLIENGKYVYLYVCEKEMKEDWNKRSELKYDSLDQYGYPIHSTLVRYLTSKGLTKDSEGIIALTSEDIQNVEKGVSNYLFKEKKWSLFSRIYKSVWEFYAYTKLDYVNNQSLSQRIEFSKAALTIINENLWFGVGPGNWKQAFFNAYKNMDSNLKENYYASSHNQYLNYLVKFGIIGFVLILFFLIYPVIKSKRYRDPVFLIFLIFMFIANLADSNFESHMGSSFFVFFYCFFLLTDGIDYLFLKKRE
ncbi:MAG: O-antigen ligase family protein [Mariniphaga sp.]|nr:O-antigen ligase family protein [Mariniphaga sp.]